MEDLNLDSVDVVEIIMIVEEVFSMELSAEEVESWRVVGDVINSVLGKFLWGRFERVSAHD